ncbi:MAG TPA: asparagine synthetase B family protein, partial [Verrucomicrobiota bacterium]|nr:asparagine synthetase B family protein [Verrucomicrobiota bacterium]
MHQYLERVVDLLDPALNRIYNLTPDEARARVLTGDPAQVAGIDGSFALVAKEGKTVRLARSLDRPMRYFLAKRHEGPALVVADRMDAIHRWLAAEGLADQFHPSYTRMVPAHHVVEIQLVGCPDPDPAYTRFFTPTRNAFPQDLDEIGALYVSALAGEVIKWLQALPEKEPVGVCFSGGIDSGAGLLRTYPCPRPPRVRPAPPPASP